MNIIGEGIAKATLVHTSCLDGFEPTYNRRSGNTTRLVDRCIQIIFSGETCIVRDHDLRGTNRKMNRYLFNRVRDRIRLEHNRLWDMFCFDRINNAIYLYSNSDEKEQVMKHLSKERSRFNM